MLKAGEPGAAAGTSMCAAEPSEGSRQEERPPTHHPSLPAVSALPLPPWAPANDLCKFCWTRCGDVRPETGLPADQVKVGVLPGRLIGALRPCFELFYLFYEVYGCMDVWKKLNETTRARDRPELRVRHLSPPVPVFFWSRVLLARFSVLSCSSPGQCALKTRWARDFSKERTATSVPREVGLSASN